MAIPRKDSTIPERIKKLEQDLRRIRLLPSLAQSAVAPLAVKGSGWFDSSAGNEPKVFDGQTWVPVRDETIAVAQGTADVAQSTATTAQSTADTAQSTATAAQTAADTAAADAATAAANALAAAGDAATALAKFPITETDISEGAITAPLIAANAIDGIVITGALLRTAASGRRVEQTAAGFVVYDASDVPLILFPTDGQDPSFAGNVRAKQLTVEAGATLRGDSDLEPGSTLQLKSGVSAPKTAPLVTIDWPSIPWQDSYGLHWDGTNWLTIIDTATPIIQTRTPVGGSGGVPISLPGFVTSHLRPWGGITKIGTDYYTLSYVADGSSTYRINKLNSSGVSTLSTTYTPIAGVNGSGGSVSSSLAPASIGTDGTNVLIAEHDAANAKYRIQTRSTTTLAVTSTINTNLAGGSPVVGITQGNFDFGSPRFVLATRNSGIKSYNSSGTFQTESFPNAAADMTGVAWNGSNFYTAAKNGGNPRVFKHTGQQYNGSPLYASYTWRDSVNAYETTMGPTAVFTPPSRSRVTLTAVAIPGLADSVRFHIGTSAARTDQWRQTSPALGVTSQAYESIATSGSNPPSTNNFPNTAPPSEVQYDDGSTAISADGSLRGVTITQGALPVATTTGTETLTNKDLSASTNIFPTFPYWYGYLSTSPTAVVAATPTTITGWVADGSPASSGITHSSGIFTVPIAGRYLISAQIWWGGITGAIGNRLAQSVKVSGTTLIQSSTVNSSAVQGTHGYPALNNLEKEVRLAASDQVFIRFQHSDTIAGGRAPTGSGPDITWVQIRYVGP